MNLFFIRPIRPIRPIRVPSYRISSRLSVLDLGFSIYPFTQITCFNSATTSTRSDWARMTSSMSL